MNRTLTLLLLTLGCSPLIHAQGMPPEARENIHALLNNHASITRTVTLTEDGYVSTTESSDSAVGRILREHVFEMQSRLESGLMVRRWDPAFAEYAAHFEHIDHTLTPTPNGLSIRVRGKNAEAVKVAQNHAEIVTDFVTNGWEGHNRTHPTALEASETVAADSCCGASGCGQGHGKMRNRRGQTQHRQSQ